MIRLRSFGVTRDEPRGMGHPLRVLVVFDFLEFKRQVTQDLLLGNTTSY